MTGIKGIQNMKQPRILLALCAMSLASSSAFSASWFTAGIQNIELTSTGDIIVFLAGPANHECGSKRIDYADPSGAAAKSILAALLAWQAQDKAISTYIASCDGTTGRFNAVINQNS